VKPHKLRKLDKLPVTAETDKSLLQATLIGYANANWRSEVDYIAGHCGNGAHRRWNSRW